VSEAPTADIEGLADSHRRLVDHLVSIDPAGVDPGADSLLPVWTIGHVLSHISRNADSILRMLAGLPQYWKGFQSRDADIELGAGRSWSELVDDVAATCAAVDRRMAEVDDWSGTVQATLVERPKHTLAHVRRREVEIHHHDLGLGYGFDDMPSDFVRAEINVMLMQWTSRQPMGMTGLPEAVMQRPERQRLAWLTGRLVVPGVEPANLL
jgi:maleylpyruvate isomerase